ASPPFRPLASACAVFALLFSPLVRESSGLQSLKRYALLVGVNDYRASRTTQGGPIPNLRGPVNDVTGLRAVLTSSRWSFPEANVQVLTSPGTPGEEPTRDRVLASLQALLGRATPGDVVLFYYSGHGSQARNSATREEDGKDETLVPLPGA